MTRLVKWINAGISEGDREAAVEKARLAYVSAGLVFVAHVLLYCLGIRVPYMPFVPGAEVGFVYVMLLHRSRRRRARGASDGGDE